MICSVVLQHVLLYRYWKCVYTDDWVVEHMYKYAKLSTILHVHRYAVCTICVIYSQQLATSLYCTYIKQWTFVLDPAF